MLSGFLFVTKIKFWGVLSSLLHSVHTPRIGSRSALAFCNLEKGRTQSQSKSFLVIRQLLVLSLWICCLKSLIPNLSSIFFSSFRCSVLSNISDETWKKEQTQFRMHQQICFSSWILLIRELVDVLKISSAIQAVH